MKTVKRRRWGMLCVAWIGSLLLIAHCSAHYSITFNEIGHLPAGLLHVHHARFGLYRVNPPLPRMIAALPVTAVQHAEDFSNYSDDPLLRDDVSAGVRFVRDNGSKTFHLYTLGRWAFLPFAFFGAWLCARWGALSFSPQCAVLATFMWCFSPNILGNAALMMPDVPSAVLAVGTLYLFRRWLDRRSWARTLSLGVILGLAELTKMTLLLLYPIVLLIWIVDLLLTEKLRFARNFWHDASQLITAFLLSLYILNSGYLFTGTCQKLGDYRFLSFTLSGIPQSAEGDLTPGNRFEGTWMGQVPVPLPRDYVQGLDRQKADFESRFHSYLRGEWKKGGWWYFYLYAIAVKVPLGIWIVFGTAALLTIFRPEYRGSLRDEMCLLVPAAVFLIAISSQDGFSIHFRYILPGLPFLYIWISKVGLAFQYGHRGFAGLATFCITWSIVSSLSIYPHSLSYFNELVGGPRNGHRHLLDSCVSWGQDLHYMKRWSDQHTEARPLHLASFGWIQPDLAGIEFTIPPLGPRSDARDVTNDEVPVSEWGPKPGWYAIDVNHLHSSPWDVPAGKGVWRRMRDEKGLDFSYFRHFQPVDRVGYSYFIYLITPDDANRVRRNLGLLELPSSE